MTKLLFLILMLIVLVVGGIFLQIFLSNRESKWLGLILPATTFLVTLLNVIFMPATGSVLQDILYSLGILIVANIPTGILLAIYFACREKIKKASQIDKMKIHDLE